ncbi:MAG: response regulator [Pyrinomonadaceae bacterium]
MGENKRVLCVEDHPDTCELISHVLKEFEVISAGTKSEALDVARSEKFALILLDYHLPDGTGEEICHLIRSFDQRTPILFVTGSSQFTESRARSIGAQGRLQKHHPEFTEELRQRSRELALID